MKNASVVVITEWVNVILYLLVLALWNHDGVAGVMALVTFLFGGIVVIAIAIVGAIEEF